MGFAQNVTSFVVVPTKITTPVVTIVYSVGYVLSASMCEDCNNANCLLSVEGNPCCERTCLTRNALEVSRQLDFLGVRRSCSGDRHFRLPLRRGKILLVAVHTPTAIFPKV